MFADEIRRAAEAAPRDRLPEISAALWKAFAAGGVSEAEAEALSALIEGRQALPAQAPTPKRRVGSRPRTDASMERRRRWATAGRLPPQLAAKFTLAEQAVLAVVTVEAAKRGDCRLAYEHLAALAGVSKSTVKAAVRRARELGLVMVTERRRSAWRNLTNVVAIVSAEWLAWMRLGRRAPAPGGWGQNLAPHEYQGSKQGPAEAGGTLGKGGREGGRREPKGQRRRLRAAISGKNKVATLTF